MIERVSRAAGDLAAAVHAGDRLTDNRCAHAACSLRLVADYACSVVVWSARTSARFASSILNPLYWSGLASAIAASAAFLKTSVLADCPSSACSASFERHGFVPTPPSATRAR